MTQQIHATGVISEGEDGNILVLRRHSQVPEGGTWGLVGGKVEEGEDARAAAVREVYEEIGHSVDLAHLQFLKTYHWEREDMDLTFDVFKLPAQVGPQTATINLETNKNTDYAWLSPQDLYKRTDLIIGLYPTLKDIYNLTP